MDNISLRRRLLLRASICVGSRRGGRDVKSGRVGRGKSKVAEQEVHPDGGKEENEMK